MVRTLREVADELGRDLGVGVGEEGHAQLDQLATQLVRIHERAVVRERDDDVVDGGEMRLCGLPALGARRAVANVAHCELAGECGEVRGGEHGAEQAEVLAHPHGAAIAHGDAGGFLATVLQRAQAEVGQTRHVSSGCPHTENTALLVQLIAIKVVRRSAKRRLPLGRLLRRANGFLRHDIPSMSVKVKGVTDTLWHGCARVPGSIAHPRGAGRTIGLGAPYVVGRWLHHRTQWVTRWGRAVLFRFIASVAVV